MTCGDAGLETFVNVAMLMECLGCSRMSVYRRCKSGELPFVKIGGRVMFRKSDLEEWFARNTHGATSATHGATNADTHGAKRGGTSV